MARWHFSRPEATVCTHTHTHCAYGAGWVWEEKVPEALIHTHTHTKHRDYCMSTAAPAVVLMTVLVPCFNSGVLVGGRAAGFSFVF